MRAKILSAVLVVSSTLGMGSAAFADDDYSAAGQGIYIGIQGGYGNVDYGSDIGNTFNGLAGLVPGSTANVDDGWGFAGRAYAGYQFNPNFGIETGYAVFPDNKYHVTITFPKFSQSSTFDAKLTTQAWDLLGKATLPFWDTGFSGHIKAGAAYMMSKLDLSASNDTRILNINPRGPSATANALRPVAGLGLAYSLGDNLAVDISYLHYFGSSTTLNSSLSVPSADLATLGISYLFA